MLDQSKKSFLFGLSISFFILVVFFTGAIAYRIFVLKPLDFFLARTQGSETVQSKTSSLGSLLGGGSEENGSSVADISEQASKSVVTVSIKKQQQVFQPSPNSPFSIFGFGIQGESKIQEIQRDIGTGFIADEGLIVTNKHVVSDPNAEYTVIDKDDKEYLVSNIYRDPATDLAILQVDDSQLQPLPMGDSDKLRVGESVIAIGTALGEFRHTVTTGVISGLGRGIEAGDGIRSIETLEGVIQTDAAINPGNSGGPLIDASGHVIGVNVATAQADNVSFAIPINVIKDSLKNFQETGRFERPFLGVSYQAITEQAAIANEVPQGVYISEVVSGSAAENAGFQEGDILTQFDGKSLKENDLASLINQKKIGDTVSIIFWRDGEEKTVRVTLLGSGS